MKRINIDRTLYLGANFVSHDAAVFGYCDGELFAIAEERFTRFKHDSKWPTQSLRALISHYSRNEKLIGRVICAVPMASISKNHNINLEKNQNYLRRVVGGSYLKDFLELEAERTKHLKGRLLTIGKAVFEGRISLAEVFKWVLLRFKKRELDYWVRNAIKDICSVEDIEVMFVDHHEAHATSAFVASGYEESLIVSMDGWGDGAFTKIFMGTGDELELLSESKSVKVEHLPDQIPSAVIRTGIFNELSVGHAYSIITWLLGFTPGADEGKVEALAAFGNADELLLNKFLATVEVQNGSIVINEKRFIECFHSEKSHDEIRKLTRETVSATTQLFLERVYLELISKLIEKYRFRRLCLAGGVAANVILNMKIFSDLGVEIFVVPSMADDGTAMGAAFIAAKYDGIPFDYLRSAISHISSMPYYGTAFDQASTLQYLESNHGKPIKWEWIGEPWPEICAKMICDEQKIGALFHGRCEFGPRALGNRSIVADLRNGENTDRINRLVKNRPGFQPFCPSFLAEEMERLFDAAYFNPHMTCAFRMKAKYASDLPCAVHIDNTARVQFVTEKANKDFFRMIKEVKRLTGYGGVLNTSFNKHGRTICESPADAVEDFVDCNIDFLIINGFLVTRNDQRVRRSVA